MSQHGNQAPKKSPGVRQEKFGEHIYASCSPPWPNKAIAFIHHLPIMTSTYSCCLDYLIIFQKPHRLSTKPLVLWNISLPYHDTPIVAIIDNITVSEWLKQTSPYLKENHDQVNSDGFPQAHCYLIPGSAMCNK